MIRSYGAPATFAALLVIASLAGASGPQDSPCAAELARNPDAEEPALCLYQAAIGTASSRIMAGKRLEQLQAEDPDNPWFSLYLAKLKWSTHHPADVAEAQRLYERTAELARREGLAGAEFQAYAGLSRIFGDSGQSEQEKKAIDLAVRIAGKSGDRSLRTRAGILQANYWTARGDLQQAYSILRPLREAVEAEAYPARINYLFALGEVTMQTGRFHEMHAAYEQLAALAEAQKDLANQAQAVYGLALSYKQELSELPSDSGREEMLRLAHQALTLAEQSGRPPVEMQALLMLGSFGNAREALGRLERCFTVASTPRQRSNCRFALARRLAASDPAAALKAIDEALAEAQLSGDIWSRTSLWPTQMRVSWRIGPAERALADSETALDAIEALRDLQGGSSFQPGLFSTWAEAYYWLSGRLLEAKDLGTAFKSIERMRSRTLIDALGVSRSSRGAPPALLARRADLFLEIAKVQRRLLDPKLGANDKARNEARSELSRLEVEEDALQAQIARADPAFAALRPPRFASLEQVRAALSPDEALLSFQIAPWKDLAGDFGGGSWLLVSTRSATRVYRLPDRVELRPAVDMFTGMLMDRGTDSAKASAQLYKKLVGAALADLPSEIRRLVIVPDDALHRLPFAALKPAAQAAPLVSRYQMTVSPSATLWLRWREAQRPELAPALVFADPVSRATVTEAASERGAAFASPISFGELRFARREGKAVLDRLGGRGELLLAEAASEAYLKRDGAAPFGLLHFATHALTDDVNPDRSGVVLSPGDAKEDGLLQVREIVDLDLDGRVVVLSSCSSASGEILRGEGVMGLARAFFQAGAHTVVASLWPLRDDYGAALFDRFYLHLAKGASVAAALQAAQRDRMDAGAPSEAWAGVVVLGNGDLVPVPGGRRSLGMIAWIGGAVLLVLVAAFLAHRRGVIPSRS